ncbi:MAG: PilZ domain-containing protein [Phycisphaerales bacterium]|nr:MAG: PilZ domain-containing protein [Phycisphaerales bacterium]
MPASRSRTDRWRDCLEQIAGRGGGVELTLEREGGEPGTDLLWRVRLLSAGADHLICEQPAAAGAQVALREGARLVGVMSIGQNRWMFHTRVVGPTTFRGRTGRDEVAVRLSMPEGVERCSRRGFYRISTAELRLPSVDVWPLLEPSSVVAAEIANKGQILAALDAQLGASAASDDAPVVLPEVGPRFGAHLVNVSGGGMGIMVSKEEASAAEELRLYWLRMDLRPYIPAPLAVTGKIVHRHIDSSMSAYCGVQFEFGFHAAHRPFVVEQVNRAVAQIQQAQLERSHKAA